MYAFYGSFSPANCFSGVYIIQFRDGSNPLTSILTLLLNVDAQAVYEHHPRPKQLIVEHDLPAKLQKLIEERRDGERSGGSGGQVLVKQMAYSLLKALHINTVL